MQTTGSTKLITWNSAGRIRALDQQVEFLRSRAPDVVALQEVTRRSAGQLSAGLRDLGLIHQLETAHQTGEGPRRYGVLLASRYPLESAGRRIEPPWAEKAISACLALGDAVMEVHTVHVPPGASNGWMKIEVLEAVFSALAARIPRPRILCGDFNTPQKELGTGEIVTWAQRISSSGDVRMKRQRRGRPAERWDAGERNVLSGLEPHGFRDAFRARHGYDVQAWSWRVPRHKQEIRRRFDHIFVSEEIETAECQYLHSAREAGLSDHAPMELEFRLEGRFASG